MALHKLTVMLGGRVTCDIKRAKKATAIAKAVKQRTLLASHYLFSFRWLLIKHREHNLPIMDKIPPRGRFVI